MEVLETSSTKKLNVYTWIIQELTINKTDQVSVVCKNGLTLSVSLLLLASISPCIKDASLSLAELEDMTIIAPDLDVSELQQLVQLISQDGCSLSEDSISESQVEFLRKFDGILWPNFYSNPVFSQEGFDSNICNLKDPPISSMKMVLGDDLNKANLIHIKDEERENYEYAFAQPPMEVELEDDMNKATLIDIKDEETEEYGNIFAQPIDYIDSSQYPYSVAQPHLKFKNNQKDYSQEFKDNAIQLVKTGCSQKKVAEMLGIGTRTIERWWAHYKREQNLKLNTFDNSESLENVKSTPAARQKKSVAEKVLENVNPLVITEYDNAVDKAALDKMIIGSDNCSFVTSNLTTLDKHVKKHSLQQTCDICGFVSTSTDPSAMKKHKAFNHDPVLHDCPECEGKFNTLQLKTHMKTHKESICNECGLKFKNLRSHVKNMHTPFHLQKYKCDLCQRGFSDSSKLKMHMYSVHTKERPFKCRYGCDLAYNDMSNRNCHEKKKHGKLFISPKKVQS